MIPRAARPILAMACAGRLSDARRALVDMRVGDDDIDGIPGPAFRFFKDLGDPCHHLPWPGRFMHGAAGIGCAAGQALSSGGREGWPGAGARWPFTVSRSRRHPPLVTMGWVNSQAPLPPAASFAQVLCIAKVPVARDRSATPPLVPGAIQAHLSAFSLPLASVQPPAGFWSVMVSAYSWPSTMEMPSLAPALPGLTKSVPQAPPASVTYGLLVKAMSP